MHHYGEDAVRAQVKRGEFRIELENHVSGAKILVTGPVEGVFEDPNRRMDQDAAMMLGQEFAHVMRHATGESRSRGTSA
jgi:hypothetical protein